MGHHIFTEDDWIEHEEWMDEITGYYEEPTCCDAYVKEKAWRDILEIADMLSDTMQVTNNREWEWRIF